MKIENYLLTLIFRDVRTSNFIAICYNPLFTLNKLFLIIEDYILLYNEIFIKIYYRDSEASWVLSKTAGLNYRTEITSSIFDLICKFRTINDIN